MLTDDDLTRLLRDAMDREGAELRYTGRVPRVRRTPSTAWVTVPAVTAVGVGVVLAGTQGHDPSPDPSRSGPAVPSAHATSSPPTASHTAAPMVTDTIKVAGYTFRYRHPAGEQVPPDDLYADLAPGPLPSDAQPVTDVPQGTRAWVGSYARAGGHALFVRLPGHAEDDLFALVSQTWTADQLSRLLFVDEAVPVPAIS